MKADNLVIGGMAAFSTVDYPQHLAATLFLQGCPWRCHYCHNPHLIPAYPGRDPVTWQQVRQHLDNRRGLLDAVIFSGGEPTIQKALLPALQETRAMGFHNGLHTGAPNLRRLRPLLPWLDWVGLDIKALPSGYEAVTTRRQSGPDSWAAIDTLQAAAVDFECRLTWHGALHASEDVIAIGEALSRKGVRRFALQLAREGGTMLNPALLTATNRRRDTDLVRQALSPCFESLEVRE